MSIPTKPIKSAEDFIQNATATKADSSAVKDSKRGRPPGPKKGPLPVRLPLDILETIRKNSGGNVSYFTEKVFRDYFERNDIEIDQGVIKNIK